MIYCHDAVCTCQLGIIQILLELVFQCAAVRAVMRMNPIVKAELSTATLLHTLSDDVAPDTQRCSQVF